MKSMSLVLGGLEYNYDSLVENVSLSPVGRAVSTQYSYQAGIIDSFLNVDVCNIKDSISVNTVEVLIKQTMRLRRRYVWSLFHMRRPARSVVKATIKVLKSCPNSDLLKGFSVANYGNGTVVLYKHGKQNDTTVNVGKDTLTYVVVDKIQKKICRSGEVAINPSSLNELYQAI